LRNKLFGQNVGLFCRYTRPLFGDVRLFCGMISCADTWRHVELQTAVCCSVLQCVAVCCSVLSSTCGAANSCADSLADMSGTFLRTLWLICRELLRIHRTVFRNMECRLHLAGILGFFTKTCKGFLAGTRRPGELERALQEYGAFLWILRGSFEVM